MEAGEVIKVAFFQADNKIKFRPAIALKQMRPYNDWLVCGISSNVINEVKGFDLVIDNAHPDFNTWGLQFAGVIRLGFLQTISSNFIEGAIGKISKESHRLLLNNLSKFLLSN